MVWRVCHGTSAVGRTVGGGRALFRSAASAAFEELAMYADPTLHPRLGTRSTS